jgi:hypothetical protein
MTQEQFTSTIEQIAAKVRADFEAFCQSADRDAQLSRDPLLPYTADQRWATRVILSERIGDALCNGPGIALADDSEYLLLTLRPHAIDDPAVQL